MTYIDTALLDLTERLCRRFQLWTGRTNVWLAFQLTNLSIIVYFVWAATLYWLSAMVGLRVFVALFCSGVFWMLSRTILRTPVEGAELQAYKRVAKGVRNPRRLRDIQLRVAFLTLSIVLSSIVFSYPRWRAVVTIPIRLVLLMDALTVLTTVVLYVLACDPLPPCAGTVTVWLKSAAGGKVVAAEES
jgi:hypothetical protein